jgi:NADPH-dependent curcumin reductase
MNVKNLQVLLVRRPAGWVREDDFAIQEAEIPALMPGEVLVRNNWLSLDPYMRGRMDEAKSYAPPVELDAVMVGGTVGRVVESANPAYQPGDMVSGYLGWQRFGRSNGTGLQKIKPDSLPPSIYHGALGMPGLTAWFGLIEIGAPKAGETVVVSAAAGAVGSVAGQIAKIKGCRAVGIAGGAAKCSYAVNELGFDTCIDYKSASFGRDLLEATPDGVDVYFENVGGAVRDAVWARLNPFARVPLCGQVSEYNGERRPADLNTILINRVKLQGFVVVDFFARAAPARAELAAWVAEGKIKYRESVVEGLENAPRAFIGMLKGENFGKQVVKIS